MNTCLESEGVVIGTLEDGFDKPMRWAVDPQTLPKELRDALQKSFVDRAGIHVRNGQI